MPKPARIAPTEQKRARQGMLHGIATTHQGAKGRDARNGPTMRPKLGRPETAGGIATALMVGPPENGTRQRAAMQRGLGARPRAWLRSSRLWRLGRCERLLPGSRRLTCTLGDREPLPAIRRRPRLRAGVRSGGNDGSWRVLRLVPHLINDSYKLTNVNWLDRAGCWNRKNGSRH